MKGMKVNAASRGIKNRGSQKMIQIYNQGQKHYESCFFPVLSEEYPGQSERENKVKEIMNDWLKDA
jgi:hypothetical protein